MARGRLSLPVPSEVKVARGALEDGRVHAAGLMTQSDDSTPRHSYPRTPRRRSRAAPRHCRRDASSGNSPEAASASAAGSRRDRMTPDNTVGTASCRRGTREPGFLVVQEGGCVTVFRLRRPRRMRDNDEVDVEVGSHGCN
jgi:hypothetical protein